MPYSPLWNAGKKGSFLSMAVALVLTAVGAYLTYASIGIFAYNASGDTIRSSAKSVQGTLILIIGVGLFIFTLFDYLVKYNIAGIKKSILGGLIISAISLPFLVYYNFYVSESTLIAGRIYTVYPYGLQPAIPFMLGLFFSFITWLLYVGKMHGNIKIKILCIRIRKEK